MRLLSRGYTAYTKVLAIAALMWVAANASAQMTVPLVPVTSPTISVGNGGLKAAQLPANLNGAKNTVPCAEILHGNGTGIGYVLSHGGVIPSTLSVSVGVQMLQPNIDYTLDPASGVLVFKKPVPTTEGISVYYRYVPGSDASRFNSSSPTALTLNFGGGSALQLSYGLSSSPQGQVSNTYGMGLTSKLVKGTNMSGMYYFSSPASSNSNLMMATPQNPATPTRAAPSPNNVNDHLIVQNLSSTMGSLNFHASYQDVGLHFNGFQALRQQNGGSAQVMSEINALEQSKGIKKLGFGGGIAFSKNSNLSTDFQNYKDGTGNVSMQNYALKSGGLTLNMSQRSISQNFHNFKGLSDITPSDRAQWSHEGGLRKNDLSAGWKLGKTSSLNFAANTISDTTGKLQSNSLNFDSKNLNVYWMNQNTGAQFGRVNDLSDAVKGQLALMIQQQFNPNATLANVTPVDKAQLAQDAGLNRSIMGFRSVLGKGSALGYQSYSIGNGQGSIQHQSLNFNTSRLQFGYNQQSIGKDFTKLSTMTAFEHAQFGNEVGMSQSNWTLGAQLNKLSHFGVVSSSVNDGTGGISQQTLGYDTPGIALALNSFNISPHFTRASDLAVPVPLQMAIAANQGFSGNNLAAHITAIKGLTLDAFNSDAVNSIGNVNRKIYRQHLLYSPDKVTHFEYLSEGNADASNAGVQNAFGRQYLVFNHTFGRGYGLNYYSDQMRQAVNPTQSLYLSTDTLHFETPQTGSIYGSADATQLNFGAGEFGNLTQVNLHKQINKAMTIALGDVTMDRSQGPTTETQQVGLQWQINKALSLTGSYSNMQTGQSGNTNTAQTAALDGVNKSATLLNETATMMAAATYTGTTGQPIGQALTGTLNAPAVSPQTANAMAAYNNFSNMTTQSVALTGTISQGIQLTGQFNQTRLNGQNINSVSDFALSNSKPLNLGLIRNLTISSHYTALANQIKTQNEALATQINGQLIGKNAFSIEYNDALLPNGQTTVFHCYTFHSDPSPKNRLHLNLMYKVMNVLGGADALVRNYQLNYALSKGSSLNYSLQTWPQQGNGPLLPLKISIFSFRQQINPMFNLALDYNSTNYMQINRLTRQLAFILTGNVNKLSAVNVGYGYDVDTTAGAGVNAHTFSLGYNQQVNTNNYFSLSSQYTLNKGPTPNVLEYNLSFGTMF